MSLEDNQATADQAAAEDAFTGAVKAVDAPREKPEDHKPATEAPPAVETKAPEYVQLTRQEVDELKASLKAATDKAASHDKQFSTWFGTVGRYEALLKEVQAKQSETTGKLSSAAFDKLKEQFPELADMTREAVTNALADKAPAVDRSEIERLRAEKLEAEMEALEDAHSDWRELIGAAAPGQANPEHPFRKWLASKDEAYQTRINKTESAVVLLRAIDRFQTETKKPAKPAPDTARADARRERIEAGVTQRGDGARPSSGPTTAEDAFLSVMKH